jgi:hypothetical protein
VVARRPTRGSQKLQTYIYIYISKEGTPPSSDSRSGKSKSPDGGSTTSEGKPGEDYSGLAMTQLGSTSTPEQRPNLTWECQVPIQD